MSISTNELFEMLSWNSDEETQQKGIEEAMKIKYLSVLLQPIEDKSVWDNCAKVFEMKTDEELYHYYDYLMEWLQDANWPGFDIVFRRIKCISPVLIISTYSLKITEAKKSKRISWLINLSGLIVNENLYKLLPHRQKALMKRYYHKYKYIWS